MAQHRHHHHQHRRLWYGALLLLLLLLCAVRTVGARDLSQISDLKSKISGVEELAGGIPPAAPTAGPGVHRHPPPPPPAIPATAGSSSSGGKQARWRRRRAGLLLGRVHRRRGAHHPRPGLHRAGATFLSVPERGVRPEDCLRACCGRGAALHRGRGAAAGGDRPARTASSGCYLFNCTYRERNVCSFTPQRGFSTYSRGGAGRPAAESAAGASIFSHGAGPSRNTAHTH
ncbi:hypothetical protein CRUP_036032 [Coryphaenoides rupestris]|nr:hypothetical protein CRUP_036032 [Coryphaenoides rupestris]